MRFVSPSLISVKYSLIQYSKHYLAQIQVKGQGNPLSSAYSVRMPSGEVDLDEQIEGITLSRFEHEMTPIGSSP